MHSLSMSVLEPPRLEVKRQSLIEKFSLALKLKHSKLFKNKNYSQHLLNFDLSEMIQQKDLSNIDYNSWMFKLDREIVNKVIQMPTVVVDNKNNKNLLPEMANNNSMQEQTKKQDLNNSVSNIPSNDINIMDLKNQKLFELRLREKEEYGKRAIENYQIFMDEKKNNKLKKKEKNNQMKEILDKQLQEKKELKKENLINTDDYYNQLIQNDKLKYDQMEKDKKNKMKEKCIELNNDRKYFIQEHRKIEQNLNRQEKKLDEVYISNNRKEVESERENVKIKKTKEKEYCKKLDELLSAKHYLEFEDKIKKQHEDEKIEQDMTERLNKQDRLRESYLNSIKAKFDMVKDMSSGTKIVEQMIKEEEEKRKREIEEDDIK